MPECFQETGEGKVLIANGIDAVLQWDGIASSARQAGVTAPVGTPTLGGVGVGTLSGTYFIAVRYVDTDGNYSDLSTYSPNTVVTNNSDIFFLTLPVPTQPDVVRRQILRNTNGQATTLYVDIDTTDLGSVSLSSNRTDANLRTQEAVPLFDDNELDIANVYGVPPSHKPLMAWHQNRMYYYGVEPYREGSVYVQASSTIVNGRGTEWKSSMVGRYIHVDGADGPRLIVSVNESSQTLAVDSANPFFFTGTPAPLFLLYASYSIRPADIEDRTFYFSGANLPVSVPATNAYVLNFDGDQPTAIMNYASFLFFMKRRFMYRLTTRNDPLTDGRVYLAINRGCVNNRCWVVANETAYILDEEGVYAFRNDAVGEPASDSISDIFRKAGFAPIEVNWQASKYFHAVYSPQEQMIRWFVSLGEDTYPRHALAFCYTLKRWCVETYPYPVPAGVLGHAVGLAGTTAASLEQGYIGSRSAKIYGFSPQGLDGTTITTATRGKTTSSAIQSLTATNYDLSNSAGASVAIVKGRGRGQVREVVEASAATIRIDRPWDVLPGAGDVFQIGGIPFEYRTRVLRYVRTEKKDGRSAEMEYLPMDQLAIPQSLRMKFFDNNTRVAKTGGRRLDRGMSRYVSGEKDLQGTDFDLSGSGYQMQRIDGGQESQTDAPKAMQVGFDGVAGPERVRVKSILINGVAG